MILYAHDLFAQHPDRTYLVASDAEPPLRYLQPFTAVRTAGQVKMMEAPFDAPYESIYDAVAMIRTLEHRLDVAYALLDATTAGNRTLAARNRELSDALYAKK